VGFTSNRSRPRRSGRQAGIAESGDSPGVPSLLSQRFVVVARRRPHTPPPSQSARSGANRAPRLSREWRRIGPTRRPSVPSLLVEDPRGISSLPNVGESAAQLSRSTLVLLQFRARGRSPGKGRARPLRSASRECLSWLVGALATSAKEPARCLFPCRHPGSWLRKRRPVPLRGGS